MKTQSYKGRTGRQRMEQAHINNYFHKKTVFCLILTLNLLTWQKKTRDVLSQSKITTCISMIERNTKPNRPTRDQYVWCYFANRIKPLVCKLKTRSNTGSILLSHGHNSNLYNQVNTIPNNLYDSEIISSTTHNIGICKSSIRTITFASIT